MLGRAIAHRHKQFAFYRPAATTIAMTVADAPNNMLQILVFSIIIYFMGGLARTAGAFFTVRRSSPFDSSFSSPHC